MIALDTHLLPNSYTPLEKSLAALSQRIEQIAVPAREVWDPWACPPEFLKVLAHAFSVDLWVDSWPETRKRSIIANAVRMHREKGTLAGVLSYLRYVDATLVEALTPPQRVFSGPSLTREQREAWLSGLPQVRTWRAMERGLRGFAIYPGGSLLQSFFYGRYSIPSTARHRMRRRVRWIVDGVETETRVTQDAGTFRLHLRGEAHARVFCGRALAGHFQPSDAQSRIVTIAPTELLPWRSPVGPRLEPISAEPERIAERGTVERGVFNGRSVRDGYFRPSRAWTRIFWRFPVNDGRRVLRRPSIQFMGVGRYRFPAHTAHLQIQMPGTRPSLAAGEGVVAFRTRYWLPHSGERLLNTRRALVAAKRTSDRVLIRYADRPGLTAGQLFLAGVDSFFVGKPSARAD